MKSDFSYCVNGVEKELPLSTERSLSDLLQIIRQQYSSDSSCISSIRVDDQELSEREEAAFGILPISDIKKIEITTIHPRELAEDTLQDLIAFTDHLSGLALEAANLFKNSEHPSRQLAKIFDGMHTFSEALEGAKQVLKAGRIDAIHILEVDLLSIMQDILDSYHDSNNEYLIGLLEKHLPENLARWRDQGLPLLIRSRDS